MLRTEILGLPIYDKPDEDRFKLNDWNEGNLNIDKKMKEFVSQLTDLSTFLNYVPINGGTFEDFDGNENTNIMIDGGEY